MLNALFLDNLDRDIQQIQHINEALRYLSCREQEKLMWRPVDVLAIKPTQDIGKWHLKRKSCSQHYYGIYSIRLVSRSSQGIF